MRTPRTTAVAFARFKKMIQLYINQTGQDRNFTNAALQTLQRYIEDALFACFAIAAHTRRGKTVGDDDIARARLFLRRCLGNGNASALSACSADFAAAMPKRLAVKQLKQRHPDCRISKAAVAEIRGFYGELLQHAVLAFTTHDTKRIKPATVTEVLSQVALFSPTA